MDSQTTPSDSPGSDEYAGRLYDPVFTGHASTAVETWEPFPGLRLRATNLGEAGFGVEVWQRAPGGEWAYRALRPADLAAGR